MVSVSLPLRVSFRTQPEPTPDCTLTEVGRSACSNRMTWPICYKKHKETLG